MSLMLDHIFIITEPGAPAGDKLVELGLTEGPANRHPGQGTANRRFFFPGFVLELLFVDDAVEARTGSGRDLGIWQRSLSPEACPYGLVVRVADGQQPAFDHWRYYPDYFNGKMCFFVGVNSSQSFEPLCICMPPSLPVKQPAALAENNAGWNLTAVELSLPAATLSPVLQQFATMQNVSLTTASSQHLELEFNRASAGKSADLRPQLPLLLRW